MGALPCRRVQRRMCARGGGSLAAQRIESSFDGRRGLHAGRQAYVTPTMRAATHWQARKKNTQACASLPTTRAQARTHENIHKSHFQLRTPHVFVIPLDMHARTHVARAYTHNTNTNTLRHSRTQLQCTAAMRGCCPIVLPPGPNGRIPAAQLAAQIQPSAHSS